MKYFQIFIAGMLASFFLFPTALTILPMVNTKILMAMLGITISVYRASTKGGGMVTKPIINLTIYGAAFSMICFISAVYNATTDYTYATYIASMWIWALAAYAVCQLIRHVHDEVSFELLSRYLVGVCVAQCIIAMLMDSYPAVGNFIDSIFVTDSDYYEEGGRLYGIGCALDPAGVRFSVVLVLLASLIRNVKDEHYNLEMFILMISLAIIVIIGNMISRTTIVGTMVAVAYLSFCIFTENGVDGRVFKWFFISMLLVVPLMVVLYNIDPNTRANLRFGFEGFFSLVETGHWETGSNNTLKTMVVWPDNWKTWIIGDGYFLSPWFSNPYYVGTDIGFFYKNTDIGYCRFIFYCGVVGLSIFSIFFVKVTTMCADLFPKRKLCLFFILIVNFIVWGKVATDIFFIFALLFFTEADKDEDEEEEENEEEEEEEEELVPMKTKISLPI